MAQRIEVIHLREDSDDLHEPMSWCGNEISPRCEDRPEKVTCRECLEIIIKFAAECADRLAELRSEKKSG